MSAKLLSWCLGVSQNMSQIFCSLFCSYSCKNQQHNTITYPVYFRFSTLQPPKVIQLCDSFNNLVHCLKMKKLEKVWSRLGPGVCGDNCWESQPGVWRLLQLNSWFKSSTHLNSRLISQQEFDSSRLFGSWGTNKGLAKPSWFWKALHDFTILILSV